jgi:hypothetical protein
LKSLAREGDRAGRRLTSPAEPGDRTVASAVVAGWPDWLASLVATADTLITVSAESDMLAD